MPSSDKSNQNSTEKNSDDQKTKNSSPNSGMMGASAVLAAAQLMKMVFLPVIPLNLMKEGSSLKYYGCLIMLL